MSSLDRRLATQLDALRQAGLTRTLPRIEHHEGVHYHLDGRPVVGFCSNDYLGLANHPSFATLSTNQSGTTASRLVCGDHPLHRQVERRLAELAETEDAILFPSGFQLNVGILPALIQASDQVFSDELNHASLIDGLRLARARPQILPHLAPPPPGSWWITEALFSMDGDLADPTILHAHLNNSEDSHLYLDEAHSFFLFNKDRSPSSLPTGLAAFNNLRPTILVGTLGKSLGCAGAFVAASSTVCTWLRGTARSFVYSTGTSPAVAAQILHALDLVTSPEGYTRRARLWANVDHLVGRLQLQIPELRRSPILRIIAGANQTAVALSKALLERGWHVQAIRPPTVPEGTARLRITLSAAHSTQQISAFADDLRALLDLHRIDPSA
jgi:8-amino-7-oxononanoate synthase